MTRKINPVVKEGKRVALEVSPPFSTLRAIFSLVKSLRPSGFENHFRIVQASHVSAFHFLKVSSLTISCITCCDRRCQTQ